MRKNQQQPQAVRAKRFTVQLPLRYRPIGETRWIDGKTQNISRTGVLFSGTRQLAVGTRLQLSLSLPLKAKLPLSVTVLCRGEVARIYARKGSLTAIGAKFLDSRLTDHAIMAA